MNTEVSGAESDIVKLKARANLLFALLSHARQELEQQKSAFHDDLKRRDGDISLLADEVRNRDNRIGELEKEVERREGVIDQLRLQLQEHKAAEENFRMILAGILQSTSWRITAPLRAVGQAIKRPR